MTKSQADKLTQLLDPQQIDAARAPLQCASTLPTGAYTSPEVFELECLQVFESQWLCVARADQVAQPGDFLVVDVPHQPIVITRDAAGQLHALSNICLHRAMPLASGSGNTQRLTCPYHLWTYELNGALRSAPMMDGAENFDAQACHLPRVQIEQWHGFLFVNLDPAAPALAPQLTGLDALIRNYRFADLVIADTLHFDSPWNWKILVENFMEAYHHIGPHQASLQPAFPAREATVPDNDGQPWSFLNMPGVPATAEGPSPFPDLNPEQRASLFAAAVFPIGLIAASNNSGVWYQLTVRDVDYFDLDIHLLLPPNAISSMTDADLAHARQLLEQVHGEDIGVNAGTWRGLNASLTRPGRLAPGEKAIWQLNQLWLERMQRGGR